MTNIPYRIIITSIVAIILLSLSFYVGRNSTTNSLGNSFQKPVNDQKLPPPQEKAKKILNREFTFPILDSKNKEISNLKYSLESVVLQDQIIVKGQRATAVKGRNFLIVNLKLQNNFTQGINIKTRDYIRLSVNNGKEWIGPDIHNDPVEVQSQATKYTRLGFAINEKDKNVKLRIGEIEGPKTIIDINF